MAETMESMLKKTIFIHSLFRTGSTYVWNKFRLQERYHCYYEPFHQIMADLDTQNTSPLSGDLSVTKLMRHPGLNRDYLAEYQGLCKEGQKGLPYFKKSFSYDNFCNNDVNPDQKKYVDFLIENAGGKIPLLQFNRSSLRIQWFKKYYPSDLHIYLVRNPFDQFCSYLTMAEEQKLDIFLVMDLITAGVNLNNGIFKKLALRIPLFEYHSQNFADEEFFYTQLLPIYSNVEKYFIFYFLWFAALLENLLHKSLVLNINLLSSSEAYRDKINRYLQEYKIDPIDFSDCHVPKWDIDVIPQNNIKEIQNTIQSLILKKYTDKEILEIDNNLDDENRKFFKIDRDEWEKTRQKSLPGIKLHKERAQKCETLLKNFSDQSVKLLHQVSDLTRELKEKKSEISGLKQKLELDSLSLNQKDKDIVQIKQELAVKSRELTAHTLELKQKDQEIVQTQRELALKSRELAIKEQLLTQAHQELTAHTQELKHEDQEIVQIKQELAVKIQELILREQLFNQVHQELTTYTRDLKQKDQELAKRDAQLENLQQRLMEKDIYINKILNGISFRLGRFLLSPFYLLKKGKKLQR